MTAKIVLIDIETAPSLGWTWEKYDTNIIEFTQHWFMLSYAYKTLDDNTVHIQALPDYPGYTKDLTYDLLLVKSLWDVLDSADIVIAHNGDAFDIKKSNARFIAHGLPPPAPYKTVDTLKIARKHFKFESNKLGDLGKMLEIGVKVPHTGFSLWKGCMAGDMDSWEKMKEYNVQDVLLLEEVYLKLRPWAATHPDVNLYGVSGGCPSCGGSKIQRRGFSYAKTQIRQRFHCQGCGHWYAGALVKREKEKL